MRSDHNSPPQSGEKKVSVILKGASSLSGDAKVLAKGKGALAEEILELAMACGIEVQRDSDLAEILVALEEDTDIPLGALASVAEMLDFLYRNQSGAHNGEPVGEASRNASKADSDKEARS